MEIDYDSLPLIVGLDGFPITASKVTNKHQATGK